ncbi:hydroxyethylthiazole kinase [Marininema mesophilum]|uniref:Hydroxyethylthiazole kinase n=1 Tax=Marininema mesophilum TaxID=1048340 RepID=A0A1H2ZGG5_9BACL|nr:hydroxyethylthiazole kinase [Marininema mesophilum]SDX16582.1 hydroxyethylthiazole kinase [Marininema mesophilum]
MVDWHQWENIRTAHPLVYHITNQVTIQDCANITLASGASPVMTSDPGEAAEMARMSQALVLNIGTPSPLQREAMLTAGRAANEKGIPIILDPVGAGATSLRIRLLEALLKTLKFSIIRGNRSEIATLCGHRGGRGVDAEGNELDSITPHFRELSRQTDATISVSGATDYITDGHQEAFVGNGTPLLAQVTGTGCMATSLTACCLASEITPFESAIIALVATGVAGEKAVSSLSTTEGIGTFRIRFFDEIFHMNTETLSKWRKVRISRHA